MPSAHDSSSGDESIDDGYGKALDKPTAMPSDLTIEKKAAKDVTKLLEKHETAAVNRYLRKYLEEWRTQKVSIAVYGDKDHGKTQLINTLRGTNSAYTVSTSCTSPMPYVYPYNSNVQFWELPPIAKDGRYKRDKYMKEINAERYDMILMLTANVFRVTSSCWLAKQFNDLGKPVIYIRTKVDEAVTTDRKSHPHTHNPARVVQRIRKVTMDSLIDNAIDTNLLYLVGAGKPTDFDFGDLITAVADKLTNDKRDALTLSMIPINQAVIAKKWEILNSRIWVLACASAAAGSPVPKCESKADIELMLEEVRFYRKQLGAQEDAFRKVRDSDSETGLANLDRIRFSKEGLESLIRTAENDQDSDQFVVSMKIVALRWWMSHLQVGMSFASTCGVLRFLLHNLQIIGLKYLKIQERERIEKEERREKAREIVNRDRAKSGFAAPTTSMSSDRFSKSSRSEKSEKVEKSSEKSAKKEKKLRKEKKEKKKVRVVVANTDSEEKEDSGQGTSSGEEHKVKKEKKEKKKTKKTKDIDESESPELSGEKKKKKKKSSKGEKNTSGETPRVIRIGTTIKQEHLRQSSSERLSTINEDSEIKKIRKQIC